MSKVTTETLATDATPPARKGADVAAPPGEARPQKTPGAKVLAWTIRNPMVLIMIALAIASELIDPGFFTIANVRNMAIQNASIGIIALGMTMVMIAGGFDLSVGAIYAIGTVIFAKWADHMPLGIAALCAIAAGGLCGGLNGIVVTRLKVNTFIATLGSASVFSGFAYWFSNNAAIIPNKSSFGWTSTTWLTFSAAVILVVVAYILMHVLFTRTVFGRNVYAVGGNREAAHLTGLRVSLVTAATFVVAGACAGFGGVIDAARSGVGQASLGTNMPLNAITIVVVGGTSLFGGDGSVIRTAVGLVVISIVDNFFLRMASPTWVQLVATGVILIFAVAIDLFTRRQNRMA